MLKLHFKLIFFISLTPLKLSSSLREFCFCWSSSNDLQLLALLVVVVFLLSCLFLDARAYPKLSPSLTPSLPPPRPRIKSHPRSAQSNLKSSPFPFHCCPYYKLRLILAKNTCVTPNVYCPKKKIC